MQSHDGRLGYVVNFEADVMAQTMREEDLGCARGSDFGETAILEDAEMKEFDDGDFMGQVVQR
jgi:hypothetical protein